MESRFAERFGFTETHKRVLQDLRITDQGPGTILRDVETLLHFIEDHVVPTGPSQQLAHRVLPEINAVMTHPIEVRLKRPVQKSYPHISGLYLICRVSGLIVVSGTGRKPSLCLDKGVHALWKGLNPTERYATLLEAWLVRGDPQIIGEYGTMAFGMQNHILECRDFFSGISEQGLHLVGDKHGTQHLRYMPGLYRLALMELFGLVAIRHGRPEEGDGWRIEEIRRTALGDALVSLLCMELFTGSFRRKVRPESNEAVAFGVLQPVLGKYWPQWQNNLSIPGICFRQGTHVFKASLGGVWRRIAMPAGASLEALAGTILDAFDFDQDHLYMFSYRDRFGAREQVYHDAMDEGPWASGVTVGDLPLSVGQSMTFLFDFGDEWQFDVTLEQVDPKKAVQRPSVVETHGKAPEQYPSSENW